MQKAGMWKNPDWKLLSGLLVAGFQLRPDRLSLAEYDRLTAAAGFVPLARWATWERGPFAEGDYAVSVHRAGPGPDRAE